ncbi:MAG TPA: ABC transporter ATP-binding protein [Chloroflexi bacterium]|nr:ABC transporter ATP-binding protein [Chloroflexota bacterium]
MEQSATQPDPLVIEGLSFRYLRRDTFAIQDINLTVKAGEIILIAGASGCGKTTLARCINGLNPRSYKGEMKGSITICGTEIEKLPLVQISQMVGTVLQDPERQILGTKVINEVAFGLENLALPREEIIARAEEAMGRLRISALKDRDTFSLSGGEKQKVALAGVLAMRPQVLMLDEPLASLDPASAHETLALVRELADEGMAVLMIEHRVDDVLTINPDRILFMNEGQVKYLGELEGLSDAVDYHAVKLPVHLSLPMARKDPPPPQLEALPGGQGEKQQLVKFENVSFHYGDNNLILHDVNLEIKRGDIIAVLGANGAGKTTLVKHAIGLLKPTAGEVLVDGKSTKQLSIAQIAQMLGYVFQSPSHMLFAPTVREELQFGPKNLKHDPARMDANIAKALRIVRLEGREEDPPLALSFGQQKRVSIAAILAMQSRILVMDEPTAGQDYQNFMNFMDAIIQLPTFEAILFITHDIDLAVIFANRVLVVNDGRVMRDGTPYEVLQDLDMLVANRLVPTSLLKENLKQYHRTGQFLRVEQLAHAIDGNLL